MNDAENVNSTYIRKRKADQDVQIGNVKLLRLEGAQDITKVRPYQPTIPFLECKRLKFPLVPKECQAKEKIILVNKVTGHQLILNLSRHIGNNLGLKSAIVTASRISDNLDSILIGKVSARNYFNSRKFYNVWTSSAVGRKTVDFLEGYKLIKKIGEGGYGQVFHARRKADNKLVAVKFFKESSLNEKSHTSIKASNPFLKMVPTEVNAMIEVEGVPGVVQLHEIFYSSEMDYIVVMETSSDATSLKDHLKERGRLPENEACHYFKQIVSSLDIMYQRKRHHFDLKDSNILIDPKTRSATLIDFGGAQRVLHKNFVNWIGTEKNFPPEYYSEKKFYGIPFESWSLGLILLQMTTGDLPVSSDPVENFKRSYEIPMFLSPDLRNLIEICLSRAPRCRPNFRKILQSPWFERLGQVPFTNGTNYLSPVKVTHKNIYG